MVVLHVWTCRCGGCLGTYLLAWLQVKQATMKAGAQDKRVKAQEYDLVLPDAIEFIAAQAMKGTLVSV